MAKFDLEDRLVAFAGEIILFANRVPSDYAGQHLKGQIIRSASSTALNYGESLGTETTKDAIHKNSLVLKELKETRVNLKILKYLDYGDLEKRNQLLQECEQLIAIVATIIKNKKRLI